MDSRPWQETLPNTVELLGQTLYAPVIACRPIEPMDYPPDRLRMWKEVAAEIGIEPEIYTGAVEMRCVDCGIAVSVGPRQLKTMKTAANVGLCSYVACLVCASQLAFEAAQDGNEVRIQGLGNSEHF